jgi:hypothetical protein
MTLEANPKASSRVDRQLAIDRRLDAALADGFPASDPVAIDIDYTPKAKTEEKQPGGEST